MRKILITLFVVFVLALTACTTTNPAGQAGEDRFPGAGEGMPVQPGKEAVPDFPWFTPWMASGVRVPRKRGAQWTSPHLSRFSRECGNSNVPIPLESDGSS